MGREIPQGQWHDFLKDFTHEHEGRKATIAVGDRSIGYAGGEDTFALTGVEAGVQAEEEDTIVVELADMQGKTQQHVTHRFEDVSHVRVREHEGSVDGLELEMSAGDTAVITLGEEISGLVGFAESEGVPSGRRMPQ